jgi:hypothetical protein
MLNQLRLKIGRSEERDAADERHCRHSLSERVREGWEWHNEAASQEMKAPAGKNDRKPEAEGRLSVGCRNPEIVEMFFLLESPAAWK